MPDQVEALLSFCQSGGRICPEPRVWQGLWNLLCRYAPAGERPPPSIELPAFEKTTAEAKAARLREQILWAADHLALMPVEHFLRQLAPQEWSGDLRGDSARSKPIVQDAA